MSNRTVFLVYGFDCYEYPYDPIKAFASEAAANVLLAPAPPGSAYPAAVSTEPQTRPIALHVMRRETASLPSDN